MIFLVTITTNQDFFLDFDKTKQLTYCQSMVIGCSKTTEGLVGSDNHYQFVVQYST